MKRLFFFFISCIFTLNSCENNDDLFVICPTDNSVVFAFTVDYTTNDFLGGYDIVLPHYVDSIKPVCKYKSPGDFGSVEWYDQKTDAKLFSGTIVWAGKGERTFPEKIETPESYVKLNITTQMPDFKVLYHDEFDYISQHDIDYTSAWNSIKNLQNISWITKETQAYIYLYCPSVGIGDPKDWYWVIFLKY